MSPVHILSSHNVELDPQSAQTPILPHDGAVLDIGPNGLRAIVQFSQIAESEIEAIRRGTLDVGVLSSQASGILILRFEPRMSGKSPIVLEMPFHIGLLSPDQRFLPIREDGLVHAMMITIQDERGRQHGGRLVALSSAVCDAIESLVERQAREAASPLFSREKHERSVRDYYKRFPDTLAAADRLFDRAHARQTIHSRF